MQFWDYIQIKELTQKQITQYFNFPKIPINLSCDSIIYQTSRFKIHSI